MKTALLSQDNILLSWGFGSSDVLFPELVPGQYTMVVDDEFDKDPQHWKFIAPNWVAYVDPQIEIDAQRALYLENESLAVRTQTDIQGLLLATMTELDAYIDANTATLDDMRTTLKLLARIVAVTARRIFVQV